MLYTLYGILMIRKNVHLTKVQIRELEKLADRTGLPVAEHIRRAIDEYLEKQKEKEKNQ